LTSGTPLDPGQGTESGAASVSGIPFSLITGYCATYGVLRRRFAYPWFLLLASTNAPQQVDAKPPAEGFAERTRLPCTRPDGRMPLPGIPWGIDVLSRDQARETWAERERELRAAGYERV
jgi:hypothetical protein